MFFFEQIKMGYIDQKRSDSPRTRCAKMMKHPQYVTNNRHLAKMPTPMQIN